MGREEEGERKEEERREKMSTEDAQLEGAMLHLIGVWKTGYKCTNSPGGRHGFPRDHTLSYPAWSKSSFLSSNSHSVGFAV